MLPVRRVVVGEATLGRMGILFLLLVAPSAASDRFPLYWIGPQGEAFSSAAGDVDGDGMADVFLVSIAPASPANPQHAIVRSGLNAAFFHSWVPSLSTHWAVGGLKPAGDLDQDGFGDIALSIANPSAVPISQVVEIRSGFDASVIAVIAPPAISSASVLGISIAGVGDLDGDGLPELLVSGNHVVSVPGCMAVGQAVYNLEAPGFGLQYYTTSWQCAQNFGSQLGRLDDVDGDGLPDFYIGAPRTDVGGVIDAGWIGIFSGASGSPITSLSGTAQTEYLGGSLAALSDVTGDGKPEIAAVRLPFASASQITLYSLPSFTTVYSALGSAIAGPGGGFVEIDQLGDADGDGSGDILARGGNSQGPSIFALSGPSGMPIGQVAQFLGGALYPFAALGDVNGDGLGDLAATPWDLGALLPPLAAQSLWSPWYTPMTAGLATVHVSRNFDLAGPAAIGGSAQFEVVAPKRAGKPFQVVLSLDFLFPGTPLGPFLFPLAMDGLFWASLSLGIGATLDTTGHGTVTVPIPNDPSLQGWVFQASGVVYDPTGPLGIGCVLTQLPIPIQ